ncbi:hypothetical protein RJ640_011803 [Escallonia rubra]|uniref:Pentatricopeptide repeat-containing protein n=1 Tax=Escallonia rubra TaxID=112253 RepID=A0AA88U2D7_9ASTE|nr:hypothetical protein RJ640_011803 [Escallonia rubra]
MIPSKPLVRCHTRVVNQVLAAMIQNRPFDSQLAGSVTTSSDLNRLWNDTTVSEVLRCVPRFFFQSARSIGCQTGFRHRAPLKQRNLREESSRARDGGVHILGPAAYRDPQKLNLGTDKALEFYHWVESQFQFTHNELTCREMACVLAKTNRFKDLWEFLKEMSRREKGRLVTTSTITCLIKVLGEQGFGTEALAAFYRMKQFHVKPDVYAYNTIIYALCRVGNFKKAKFLFDQMELPGFRCPPDTFTYTILISSYCRHSMQTGCRKAIRRRLWEANHLFRGVLFLTLYYSAVNEIEKAIQMLRRIQNLNHGLPTTSSYIPIIHALCEAGRMIMAWDFLVELIEGGSIPREYTYRLVSGMLKSAGESGLLDEEVCRRI